MKKFLAVFLLLGLAGMLTAANTEVVRIGPKAYTMAIPVAAATHLYQGDAICTNTTNAGAILCTDAASRIFWGFASAEADNSTGLEGAIKVQVEGGIYEVTFDTIANTNLGAVAYVKGVTGKQFAVSGTANALVAGRVVHYTSSTKGWIDTRNAVTTNPSTVTGTNVSIADAGNYWTSATAEDLSQEIGALSRGYIPVGSAAGKFVDTDFNNSGYIGVGDGTDYASVDVTGDIDISTAGVVSITAASIVDADINHAVANRTMEVDYCFWYDFATHTGAAGTIDLTKCGGAVAQPFPDNFVISSCTYEVQTAMTAGGADDPHVEIGIEGATTNIAAHAAFNNAAYAVDYTATLFPPAGVGTKTANATTNVQMVVADHDITGGTIYVYCRGHQSN